MKHRVADLEGALLDHAVALAEGDRLPDFWYDPDFGTCWARPGREEWRPSERWAQGGPIIERERIYICFEPWSQHPGEWQAGLDFAGDEGCGYTANHVSYGPTPLVAAMRAYARSKLGDEVDLP